MSKIFRHTETQEIEHFLSDNDKISPQLKRILKEELNSKTNKYKDSFIWLVARTENIVIDVFDIKGDMFETETFYFKDFPL